MSDPDSAPPAREQPRSAREDFGLYLVMTDPAAGYAACTEAAVQHGVRYVQLRMKDGSVDEVTRVAQIMRSVTRGTATRFIVNDNVTVARAVGADGVHLGQSDMPLAEARRHWPESTSRIFGLSTHNEEQARTAERQSPDYIGVGPLFATPTKRVPDPVIGIERAAAIVAGSTLTCVAIGGIDRQRLEQVLAAGIRNFAVVRYVCRHPRPSEPISELMRAWKESRR